MILGLSLLSLYSCSARSLSLYIEAPCPALPNVYRATSRGRKMADEEEDIPTPRDASDLSRLGDKPPPRYLRGPSGHIYHSTSVVCLKPHDFPRNVAIHLVENPWFEPFIAMVITFNCIELAWDSPLDPSGTWKADFIASSDQPLLWIFTLEMCTKILAYGFLMHRSFAVTRLSSQGARGCGAPDLPTAV